jgi:hypothetical protein
MIYQSTGEVRAPKPGEFFLSLHPGERKVSRVVRCFAFPFRYAHAMGRCLYL